MRDVMLFSAGHTRHPNRLASRISYEPFAILSHEKQLIWKIVTNYWTSETVTATQSVQR